MCLRSKRRASSIPKRSTAGAGYSEIDMSAVSRLPSCAVGAESWSTFRGTSSLCVRRRRPERASMLTPSSYVNRTGLRLPPYAREVVAAKSRGERLNLFVHAGAEAWRRASGRPSPHVICLPPDKDFGDFDWSCVGGLTVTLVVWDRPGTFVCAFAEHLVRCGAERVAVLNGPNLSRDPFGPVQLTIYKARVSS